MFNLLKRFFLFILILNFNSFLVGDQNNYGLEILKKTDKNMSGYGDSQSRLVMQLINAKGEITERSMRSKLLEVEDDGDKSLFVFESPRAIKGTALLSYAHKVEPDDQWLYIPAIKRVKRIISKNKSGPFLGSEFSVEDLSFQEIEKFSYKYLRDEQYNNQDCFVVERVPLDPYSGYTKQLVWVDKTNYLIQKVELFDRKAFHLKSQFFRGYKRYLSSFWRPGEIEMINHQNGKSTILRIEEQSFQNGLTDSDFTQNSLKRSK